MRKSFVLASAAVLVMAACGGGGSSPAPVGDMPPPPPPPPAGQSETFVTASGEITGFGSVFVGGERYDTDTADITSDGRTIRLSDLSVGQVVSLRARRNGNGEAPTALRLRYEEVVEGPVASIAADRSFVIVLGQTVLLTEDTLFEDITRETINVGDRLEVSGQFDANGDIVATYVELSDDVGEPFEVHGRVADLDEGAQTFRLGNLTVGYASAQLEDFDDGETLSNGDLVEVEGTSFDNTGTFLATRVEYEGDDIEDLEGDDGDDDDEYDVEIYGFITAFTDSTNFEVNGIPVITDANTQFERCRATELALNVRVEVEGRYDDNGVLVATKVQCEREANLRFTGAVDGIDVETDTITVLGVTFQADMRTRYKDRSDADEREFRLDDIAVGDIVQVRAYASGDDEPPLAKRIERGDRDRYEEDAVRGFIESVGNNSFVVTGVTVTYDARTEFEIEERDVDASTFFNEIGVNDFVKVEGVANDDNVIAAAEVEYERDDD